MNFQKLSALKAQKLTAPGYYGDGAGLWLQISKHGGKSWVFRYRAQGRLREMGLGSFLLVSLADARKKTLACRQLLQDGKDPIGERRALKESHRLKHENSKTFSECSTDYIETHKAGWKNEKHAKQWKSTLQKHAYPILGKKPVSEINTQHILKAIEPIWLSTTETANRVRNRIEAILDWATVHGYRQGDNPARWKGHMDKLLPARNKVQKINHMPALSHKNLPQFMGKLKLMPGISARAAEFLVLTAARSGEVRNAVWDEINFSEKLWIIPSHRMKAGKEHRIPLTTQTIALLKGLPRIKDCQLLFPGPRTNAPLSDMSLTAVLKRMDYADITMHGFRSTFRDWAGETTPHPREVIEHALAHQLRDQTEAAYQRGDLLEKRRSLMKDWEQFCLMNSE